MFGKCFLQLCSSAWRFEFCFVGTTCDQFRRMWRRTLVGCKALNHCQFAIKFCWMVRRRSRFSCAMGNGSRVSLMSNWHKQVPVLQIFQTFEWRAVELLEGSMVMKMTWLSLFLNYYHGIKKNSVYNYITAFL